MSFPIYTHEQRGPVGISRTCGQKMWTAHGWVAKSSGLRAMVYYPASTVIRPRPTPAMAAAFATLRPLPSPLTGLPRLPEPPFRRTVPTTPADRAGARVDCFRAHIAFPKMVGGSASALSLSRHAQASLTLQPAGLLNRLKRPLSRGFS